MFHDTFTTWCLDTTRILYIRPFGCGHVKAPQIWGSPHGHWKRIHWIRIPDPDSMWSRVSSTRHADYGHCTAWLDLTHCHAAQHAARIRIEAVGRQSGLWIWIQDPRYPHRIRVRGHVWRAPICNAFTYTFCFLVFWRILFCRQVLQAHLCCSWKLDHVFHQFAYKSLQ